MLSLYCFIAAIILEQNGRRIYSFLEEGDFAVDTRVLPGSNLTTTIESTQKAAHILKTRFPEVEKVVTKIGSGEVPTDPMPMDASDMMVSERQKRMDFCQNFPELAEKMSKALEDVPGITVGFQYPVADAF
jgi:cobalt-zinc-cadmium resistance protein CzcA